MPLAGIFKNRPGMVHRQGRIHCKTSLQKTKPESVLLNFDLNILFPLQKKKKKNRHFENDEFKTLH